MPLSVALPVAGLIHHDRQVRRAIAAILAGLAARPRVSLAGMPRRRGLHAIEIVALVLFGPGTFIDLYASLSPHAFDHTPWMGRHLDGTGVAGLLAFAVILWRRRQPGPPGSSADAGSSPPPRRRALLAEAGDTPR